MRFASGFSLEVAVLLALGAGLAVGALSLVDFFRRRAARRRFGNQAILAQLSVGRGGPWRAARATLIALGVAFAVFAALRPQYGGRTEMLRKRGIDVCIVLDFSKSMLARDVRPSRIDRAKAEVSAFLDELGGDRVGVVAFAGETMQYPLTTDYDAVKLFLRDLGPYDMPVGGTAIGRALTSATQLFERGNPTAAERRRAKVVILMTDGEDHEGDPINAARTAAQAGIVVHVLGIGSRSGEPIPLYAPDGTWTGYMRDEQGNPITSALTAENERQLRDIARAANGKFFRAREGEIGMEAVRREMRRMRAEELRARRVTVYEEVYAVFLVPAFLLVVLGTLLPEAWPRGPHREPRAARIRRRRGPSPNASTPKEVRR
ncbi:MAG: VWA domain-containing protein [Deltaproteobacteria bacterium]|nr:VWA domain-containing protein [Deltaproteobacteria bacterium]